MALFFIGLYFGFCEVLLVGFIDSLCDFDGFLYLELYNDIGLCLCVVVNDDRQGLANKVGERLKVGSVFG